MFRIVVLIPAAVLLLARCSTSPSFPPVPLDTYHPEPGFQLDVVAAEPLLDAPVAMCFDERGRIWVVEMRGYMTDLDNSGEHRPSGRISILEDLDTDGIMDRRTTFLDSLVLPRALALVYGGLLYAEPPRLWFVDIDGARPGARTLVDSAYAGGGNVEHQPNGLLPALDNWIYSAKSDLRYRRLPDGSWERQKTHFRGQWGITQDDFGRLFYNDNSNQLQGDWLPPNALLRNRFFQPDAGFNVQICTDQRVWPLRASPVNRGYEPGMLDSSGLLKNVTSACGPLIYHGGRFPPGYTGNAFVCAPEANLVKRNAFNGAAIRKQAAPANPGKDFLAATDPGFRPVNLCEGPDGSLYIVDMHRGIIQHKTYMTAYLREQIEAGRLDTIYGCGRILRLRYGPAQPERRLPDFQKVATAQLAGYLKDTLPWLREQARRQLIGRSDPAAASILGAQAVGAYNPVAQLQALSVLDAGDDLNAALLLKVAGTATEPWVALTALRLLERQVEPNKPAPSLELFERLFARRDSVLDMALCLYAGPWGVKAPEEVYGLLGRLLDRYPQDTLFQEAIVSGLSEQEAAFSAFLLKNTRPDQFPFLKKTLRRAALDRRENRPAAWTSEPRPVRDDMTRGLLLFQDHCTACHGPSGQGTTNLAPPLAGSEWVGGDPDRLGLIVLHGLQGPLTVKGKQYTLNGSMPGLAANPELTNADLAALLSYVRNAFSSKPVGFSAGQIGRLRRARTAGKGAYRAEEFGK